MTRVTSLNQRYAACAALVKAGIQIFAVGDPAGARFSAVVRRLVALDREDGGSYLDDLVGASKALNWRRITQPQPLEFNLGLREAVDEVTMQSARLRGAIADQELLDDLAAAAALLASNTSPLSSELLSAIEEVGARSCIVIAASKQAAAGLDSWLRQHKVPVVTAGELEGGHLQREQAYVVGPPRIYRHSLVTAPVTAEVSFLLPAWFRDRKVPRSPIAAYAEWAIQVEARVFTLGDTAEPVPDLADAEDEGRYLPQPVWGTRRSEEREPTAEEVNARKLLLSSNLAMWLDDGERIRSLDPRRARGERVTTTEVAAVREGTYLLLREGVTERAVLYQAALARLGPRAEAMTAAQTAWKRVLGQHLQRLGNRQVVKALRAVGISAADQARAWTDPSLIRPQSDQDFDRLLQWLDIPSQPTFGYATTLRTTLYEVSAEIGKQLEAAVADADLSELETVGHLGLAVDADGFRGILATRVLAISPFSEIVSRHEARVPFEDRGGMWLE